MTRDPRLWLVAYDVCDERRLRRVFRIMRGYGDHMQYSVFLCLLSELQKAQMVDRLVREIKPSEDQILLVPLGGEEGPAARGMSTLGLPMTRPERVVRVIGP